MEMKIQMQRCFCRTFRIKIILFVFLIFLSHDQSMYRAYFKGWRPLACRSLHMKSVDCTLCSQQESVSLNNPSSTFSWSVQVLCLEFTCRNIEQYYQIENMPRSKKFATNNVCTELLLSPLNNRHFVKHAAVTARLACRQFQSCVWWSLLSCGF